MATNVISPPRGAIMEFSSIVRICKYKRFHEGHHFILMVMEVHDTPERDMDHFIMEYVLLFHDRRSRYHLSLSFYIQFFKQCVSITLQCVLAFAIKKIRLFWWEMFILNLLLLLDLTICMKATLKPLWMKKLPTTKGTNFLLFWFLHVAHMLAFF